MSFTAKDNNIKITNSSGTTVFDTSTPMPHITNTISTNITHTFPSSATYLNKYKNWCWYYRQLEESQNTSKDPHF